MVQRSAGTLLVLCHFTLVSKIFVVLGIKSSGVAPGCVRVGEPPYLMADPTFILCSLLNSTSLRVIST
tara:strand:- start:169 stop:372 length:204 start_codon:yes stop_codon:yes gene_type:complete